MNAFHQARAVCFLFSYFVSLKALLLIFLPNLFCGIVGNATWLSPNNSVELMGIQFNLAIIGNALEKVNGEITGGLAFTLVIWSPLLW